MTDGDTYGLTRLVLDRRRRAQRGPRGLNSERKGRSATRGQAVQPLGTYAQAGSEAKGSPVTA